VLLWRAVLCLLALDESNYARHLRTFLRTHPAVIIEFDSCLHGLGVLWYIRDTDGAETIIGGSALDLRPFGFGTDSSYQNLCEFLGATMGLVGLMLLGLTPDSICFSGDSISALTWADEERYRGDLNTNASLVYTLTAISMNTFVGESDHLPKEDNWRCDGLSRHESFEQLGLGEVPVVDLLASSDAMALLKACDPARRGDGSEAAFLGLWGSIKSSLTNLSMHSHSPPTPTNSNPHHHC
jgi:hypothetical protein